MVIKLEIPENWSVTSREIVNDPDDEDLWQASCGDYTLDIGSRAGEFRCRAIKHRRWLEPVDDVTYDSVAKACKWALDWMARLV